MGKTEGVRLLRTFIAIELPTPICHYLFQYGQKISAEISPKAIRWVEPDKMHLTLRFLGNTPQNKLPEISTVLDTITSRYQSFNLYLDQLGAFPNTRRPRVIWAGLAGNLSVLNTLQKQIEKAVQEMGWQEDNRPFRPHLTLGRVKEQQQAKDLNWDLQLRQMEFTVSAVNLIESQLRPTGPIYTIQHISKLTDQKK